jgi:hypothetical protein
MRRWGALRTAGGWEKGVIQLIIQPSHTCLGQCTAVWSAHVLVQRHASHVHALATMAAIAPGMCEVLRRIVDLGGVPMATDEP